jgi:predicted kinase
LASLFVSALLNDMSIPAECGRLVILCGLPGSGKTVLAKRLEREHRGVRFCPDEWMQALDVSLWDEERRARIEALQWQLAQHLLAGGMTVIIEWGTWGRDERDALRVRARELGAAVELHYLSAPLDVLFERIARRRLEDPPINREQLAAYAASIQIPTPDEMALYDPPLMRTE